MGGLAFWVYKFFVGGIRKLYISYVLWLLNIMGMNITPIIHGLFYELTRIRADFPNECEQRYNKIMALFNVIEHKMSSEERKEYYDKTRLLLAEKIRFSQKRKNAFTDLADIFERSIREWFNKNEDKFV